MSNPNEIKETTDSVSGNILSYSCNYLLSSNNTFVQQIIPAYYNLIYPCNENPAAGAELIEQLLLETVATVWNIHPTVNGIGCTDPSYRTYDALLVAVSSLPKDEIVSSMSCTSTSTKKLSTDQCCTVVKSQMTFTPQGGYNEMDFIQFVAAQLDSNDFFKDQQQQQQHYRTSYAGSFAPPGEPTSDTLDKSLNRTSSSSSSSSDPTNKNNNVGSTTSAISSEAQQQNHDNDITPIGAVVLTGLILALVASIVLFVRRVRKRRRNNNRTELESDYYNNPSDDDQDFIMRNESNTNSNNMNPSFDIEHHMTTTATTTATNSNNRNHYDEEFDVYGGGGNDDDGENASNNNNSTASSRRESYEISILINDGTTTDSGYDPTSTANNKNQNTFDVMQQPFRNPSTTTNYTSPTHKSISQKVVQIPVIYHSNNTNNRRPLASFDNTSTISKDIDSYECSDHDNYNNDNDDDNESTDYSDDNKNTKNYNINNNTKNNKKKKKDKKKKSGSIDNHNHRNNNRKAYYSFDLGQSFKNDVMGAYNNMSHHPNNNSNNNNNASSGMILSNSSSNANIIAPTTIEVVPPYPMMEETSDSEVDSWAQTDGTVGSLEERLEDITAEI